LKSLFWKCNQLLNLKHARSGISIRVITSWGSSSKHRAFPNGAGGRGLRHYGYEANFTSVEVNMAGVRGFERHP
jgi:hypothetical protein